MNKIILAVIFQIITFVIADIYFNSVVSAIIAFIIYLQVISLCLLSEIRDLLTNL